MNTASSTSTVLSNRPGTDPVFGPFGGLFRTTLHSLQLRWFLYRRQRRKSGAAAPLGEMSAHMLKDIGAPDGMIASASAERPAYARHGIPFALTVAAVALSLTGTATPTSAETLSGTDGKGSAAASSVPMVGVFAGEYVNDAPVYRLPAVVVIGIRNHGLIAKTQPCRQTLASRAKTPA